MTQFTQAEVAAGSIVFVHTGTDAPSYRIRVLDASLSDGPRAATIIYSPLGGAGLGGGGGVTLIPDPGVPSLPPSSLAPPPTLDVPRADTFLRTPTNPAGEGGDVEPVPQLRASAGDGLKKQSAAALDPKELVAGGDSRDERVAVSSDAPQFEELTPVTVLPMGKDPVQIVARPALLEMPEGGQERRLEIVLDSVRISALALSVGAVWWALRATGLIASLLASAPAWRHIDPLPVLGRGTEEEDEQDVDWGEPEDVDAKRQEQAADWVLEERGPVSESPR